MFCEHCGNKMEEGSTFCKNCGKNLKGHTHQTTSLVTIKCANCEYVGHPVKARRVFSIVLAWLCIFFAPLITVIYFLATDKYKCPKCNSTFIGIKNKYGVFVGQRGNRGPLMTLVWIVIAIAIIGIVSSVILASLQSAREKGAAATIKSEDQSWITYNSVADKFSISFPQYPTIDSESGETNGGISYKYNTYSSEKDSVTYMAIKYIYSDEIDVSGENEFLEKMANIFTHGAGGTLVSSDFTYHSSKKSLDFLAKTENGYIRGSIVLDRQTPYLLLVQYPTGTNVEIGYQKFISSFQIK